MLAELRQYRDLGRPRRGLFLRSLFLLMMVGPVLRVFGFKRLRAILERRSAGLDLDAISASERSWAEMSSQMVELAGRHGLASANCLDRSLVLHWLLAGRGIGSELRIGVDRENDSLKAHAWVECGGLVLGNPAEIADLYLPLEARG